jgi:anhydro-N-acetylmuramic acid kinase
MSGTSLDGVDVALIKITGNGINTRLKQIGFITYPFPKGLNSFIKQNAEYLGGNVTNICQLNFLISHIYVDSIIALCQKIKFPLSKVDLIGSHGQTIHHLPKKEKLFGYNFGSTLQLGDPSVIAKLIGIPVIGDFRVADVALYGQGAPFVPYFDYIMLRSNKNRALLNIGGISNITILSKDGNLDDVIAFDCGPGNMLIDFLMKKFFNKEFDDKGKIALSGKVTDYLLKKIIKKDSFLFQEPPKSSGREFYGKNFLSSLLKSHSSIPKEDWLATITNYTAYAIYKNFQLFSPIKIEELIVSGGGAKNRAILKSLRNYFGKNVKVNIFKHKSFCSDAKEAVCFAVLANETINGNTANIPNVTGALRKTILGKICPP